MQTTNGYIEVEGGKLYYEMVGEGETLVLNHAGFVDSGMWDAQWEVFAQHFCVIRFDMRGFGKSSLVQSPISRRADLGAALKHLKVERAHLVGCSTGGEVIMDFALENPAMVASLTLVSAVPGGFELQGEPPPYLMEMMGAVQQGDLETASDLQIRIWIDGQFRQPEQVNPQVRQQAARMNRIFLANGTWAADMNPLNPLNPPAVGRLNEIHVPTLIVTGTLDNSEILRAGDVMASQIPNAKKVVLPDTAHMPSMEQPELFNRTVLGFLGSS
ncbi:MAG: alpha/beta hydrolase [Anaerolineae bacterium]|nr:alpha/beta hydrolase [Anaerolineae bacterium]